MNEISGYTIKSKKIMARRLLWRMRYFSSLLIGFTCLANAQSSSVASFLPNSALSKFIDKYDFPKNIVSKDELMTAVNWENKDDRSSNYYYLLKSTTNEIKYCKIEIKDGFIQGSRSFTRSDIREEKPIYSITKQILPDQNNSSNLNLESEYGKLIKLFGRPSGIRRNQEMRLGMTQPTNEIEYMSYKLMHKSSEMSVGFYISKNGCFQVSVAYLGPLYAARRSEEDRTKKNGSAISDVLN